VIELIVGITALIVLAVALLLIPLLRRGAAIPESALSLAVYKDQLAELERDVARGVVLETDAAGARREIERRILRAAGHGERAMRGTTWGRATAAAAILALPVFAVLVYAGVGSPGAPDEPFASRSAPESDPSQPNIQAMVAGLEKRLQANPNDVDGWLMLGRSRMVLGEPDAAIVALRHAVEISPDAPEALSGLGEALVDKAGGIVTPESEALFAKALAGAPDDPRAGFYLGLARAQAGENRKAVGIWQDLLAKSPADAPWRPRVVAALRQSAESVGLDASQILAKASGTETATGPSEADVARFRSMTPEQRRAAIEGMVQTLESRLATSGGDAEGWRRLGRAKLVLGDRAGAEKAYAKALQLAPDDTGTIKDYASALLGPDDPTTKLPTVPEKAADLFAKAQGLAPDDPEPYWYLGIRSLQTGDVVEAKADWRRLLTLLGPKHPDYAAVKARLDALGS
jgi:cytochrome c-type biogenesis protein CcmH